MWGWEAHPSQREWLLADAPVKAAACGRRWGKTEAQSIDTATFALCVPGSEQMIVAPTYDQARLIAGGVERLLLSHPTTRTRTTVRKTPYPRITVGASVISARSADDDGRSLRGHRADRAIVDEAAFVRDQVITEVVQPMLADTDGQLILISTPCGRNLFWRIWMSGQGRAVRGRVRSYRFPSSANPHISARYIEEQRRELPERSFQAEYLAEFVDSTACVFPHDDILGCLDLGRTRAGVQPARVVAGIDWARYSDYTVCIAVDVGARPWRVTAIDRFHLLSWKAAVERAADFLERTGARSALCDATSVGDPLLEELQRRMSGARWGCEVEGLVFTSVSKRDMVDHLAVRLAHRDIALGPPDDPAADVLASELECFEYHTLPSGSVTYAARPGAHDDCVSALALAVWGARRAPDFRVLTASSLRGGLQNDCEYGSAYHGR